MPSRDQQNEVDAAHALLRAPGAPGTRSRTFGDVTHLYAPNRPGRPSPGEARRLLLDFQAGDLLAGTKLRRTFKGVDHVVYVVPTPADAPANWRARGWGRYVYRGERHKSLTSIARLIVGDADPRISGNRFFGLRRRRDEWFDDGVRWTEDPRLPWRGSLYPNIAYLPNLIVASGRHSNSQSSQKSRKIRRDCGSSFQRPEEAETASENPA